MNTIKFRLLGAVALLGVAAASGVWATELDCTMDYSMKGWSAFYKTAHGHGRVSCSDGKTVAVVLDLKGGGFTAGTSSIDNGHGTFKGVRDVTDVYGDYATAGAGAGAVESREASVLTKGDVSLELTGGGSGWNVGVAAGRFRIERDPKAAADAAGTTGQ